MKKFVLILLSVMMCFSVIGCGKKKEKTVGSELAAVFQKEAGDSVSAYDIATVLSTCDVMKLDCGVMDIVPGYLAGFDNTAIEGFSEGAVFMPWIGSQPFVGYVFTTDDPDGLIKTLEASANLRWNICTEAEEMVSSKKGNKVFFVMCPKSFDE